jgi:protein-S-isoprenylcysteine O-methyltransferase Ste14
MQRLLILMGNFFFRYRNALFPLFVILAAAFARPYWALGSRRIDLIVDLLGVLVIIGGQVMRALTVGYDYIVRGGKGRKVYADNLVSGGMFAHSRNPLYLGNLLIFFGIALVCNAPEIYLVGIPLVMLVYASIIAAEEDYLIGKFGAEYEDYCRRVNRLWPRWKGFRQSIAGMSFDWKRLASKEHNTTFGWILGVILVEAWSEYRITNGAFLNEPLAVVLGGLFAFAVVLYGLVHFFKKAGAFS